MEQLISTDMAAQFLGVSRPTIIKYIQEGKLNANRTGKAYKIGRIDLETFARSQGINGTRMAQLEQLFQADNKKTRSLLLPNQPPPLKLHPTPQPLIREGEVLYFLAAKPHPQASELVFRITTTKYFIGRHGLASLSIQDPYISSLHATLSYDAEQQLVKCHDQSTNGTHLRNTTLKNQSHDLGDDDQLRVGAIVLTLISARRIEDYLANTMK